MREKALLVVSGVIVAFFGVLLVVKGNPVHMGFCIACFLRDIAGAVGLHRAGVVQYIRPEIIGFVLGAFLLSLFFKEHQARGGSSTLTRFFLGVFMMIGSLIFLGCPLRMILRLAGGDLNALIGFFGYVFGVWVGIQFLKNGYTLGRSSTELTFNAYIAPVMFVGLLLLLVFPPDFIFFSSEGPGSMRAPWVLALVAGLLVGALGQRSRFCTMGGIRDIMLLRDYHLFSGLAALFLVALAGNILTGNFSLGFADQPVAHQDFLWNFVGLGIVGTTAVLAGGCPFRQLVLSGEGDTDALATVLGLFLGAAICHNFGLAAGPAGVPVAGKIAAVIVWVLVLVVGKTRLKEKRD